MGGLTKSPHKEHPAAHAHCTRNLTYQLLQVHVGLDPLCLRDVKTVQTSKKIILVLFLQIPETGEVDAVNNQREFSK